MAMSSLQKIFASGKRRSRLPCGSKGKKKGEGIIRLTLLPSDTTDHPSRNETSLILMGP